MPDRFRSAAAAVAVAFVVAACQTTTPTVPPTLDLPAPTLEKPAPRRCAIGLAT